MTETRFIRLDTRLCLACWECVKACPNHALGRVNLPFHKHALVSHAEACRGCLRCVRACLNRAIIKKEEIHDCVIQPDHINQLPSE